MSQSTEPPKPPACDDHQPREPRARNGRFASPFSGNPKGRPPKTKEDAGALLRRLLEEPAPQTSGSANSPPSVGELLLRRTIVNAMADPRLALAFVKLMLAPSAQANAIIAKDDLEQSDRERAILDGFVTRQMRSRRLGAQAISPDTGAEEEEP